MLRGADAEALAATHANSPVKLLASSAASVDSAKIADPAATPLDNPESAPDAIVAFQLSCIWSAEGQNAKSDINR